MKRALLFLFFGPSLVVLTLWVALGTPGGSIVAIVAALLFLFTLPASAVTGLVDGCLAGALPLLVRAPLTAMVGAMAAVVLPAALLGSMPQDMSMLFGIGGALCAGVCSLLAHDYRGQKTRMGDIAGSLS